MHALTFLQSSKLKEEAKDYGTIKTDKTESAPHNGEHFGFMSLFDTRVMRKHSLIM